MKLPAGTQLLERITQAVLVSKGVGKSSLGMMFDRFKGSDGQEHALEKGIIRSIGNRNERDKRDHDQQATADASSTAPADVNAHASAQANANGGGLLGGVVNGVGNTLGNVAGVAGKTATGLVGTVTSLPGVLLDSTGTLVAQGRNVSVPAGTQLSVAASANAFAQ